jgi:hypothetical protein
MQTEACEVALSGNAPDKPRFAGDALENLMDPLRIRWVDTRRRNSPSDPFFERY